MTGIAAIALCAAFTSCSKESAFEQMTPGDQVHEKYNQAFLKYIGGTIDPNQDWGFSATRGITRSNPGDTYPATHTYSDGGANCNANQWADPNEYYGGWVVPDPLTEEQKAVVAAYFQSVSPLSYEDPHLRHFFVQQVYKGGNSTVRNTTEGIIAADNSAYTSDNMNHLTVGQSNMHINNFNAGTCSPNTNVLQNDGTTKTDQIMLMVNIDDTSCFGYHDSGSSNQTSYSPNHNDKAALVSWQTIRTWANANGLNGDCLNDKWNRSFLGFDLAIKEGALAQSDIAVKYNDGPESYSYAKINNQIVPINGNANILFNNKNIYYLSTNKNMYVAADSKNIGDSFIQKEYYVNGQYVGKYIDVDYLMTLIDDGWLPVNDKNLREWVKVGKSDGYYSDWIVTLTEAKRQVVEQYDLKIIAEDLSASTNSDFDFNDIVLEVKYGSPAKVRLTHAGGTLPLRINDNPDFEVHKLFGVQVNEMVNTGAGPSKNPILLHNKGLNVSITNAAEADSKLKLTVYKGGDWQEMTAPKGEPACKLAVGINYPVLKERVSIKGKYPLFVSWANGTGFTSEWWTNQ